MQSAEEEEETATKTVGAAAVATSHFMSAAAAVQWGKEGTCFSRSLHSPSFLASSSCSLGNLGQKRCHVWPGGGCECAKSRSSCSPPHGVRCYVLTLTQCHRNHHFGHLGSMIQLPPVGLFSLQEKGTHHEIGLQRRTKS